MFLKCKEKIKRVNNVELEIGRYTLVPSTKFCLHGCDGTSLIAPSNTLCFSCGVYLEFGMFRINFVWLNLFCLYIKFLYRTKLSYLCYDLSQGHLKIFNHVTATTKPNESGPVQGVTKN